MAELLDKLTALCKRRGFIFHSSEIYGGINGFWDYGPLGVELKNNLKNAWWSDIVRKPRRSAKNDLFDVVGLDSSIIMSPKAWEASGHVSGFNDPMIDCKVTKMRYRADHVLCGELIVEKNGKEISLGWLSILDGDRAMDRWIEKAKVFVKKEKEAKLLPLQELISFPHLPSELQQKVIGPDVDMSGTLTEPRQFNLMFQTNVGAMVDVSSTAYLRPETAQGIFVNFRNVVDTSRVKIPFGIAQIGKAFRNEVTPRHFIFRSREFEQMELEFFVHPTEAEKWHQYWCEERFQWWVSIGIKEENLQLRRQTIDELAHYAKTGAGSCDIEYKFPFTAPGFGELEGIAHRTDYDLKKHAEHSGLNERIQYYDQENKEHYFPHVIEPSSGVDRGVLALLCDAYTEDPERPSKLFMKFHPRIAPIKAAIFPLVNKDDMPEIAENIYCDLARTWNIEFDAKQSIGKRYARMDEAGAPYCFTIDNETLSDKTVTVRFRDTLKQIRLPIEEIRSFLQEKIST